MKLSCEIVGDLLPLFVDDVCSGQSKQAVSEHLRRCETCNRLFRGMQSAPVPSLEPEKPTADKAVAKSFKKIRLRWLASVLSVLVLVPLAFLCGNQHKANGDEYTGANTVYELQIGHAFMQCLEAGKYEEAYPYIDMADTKEEWLAEWFSEETLANLEADGLAKFCEYGAKLEEAGGIDGYEFIRISESGMEPDGTTVYRLFYRIQFAGKGIPVQLDVSTDGVEHFSGGGSFLNDPLAQFSIWKEYLWQDYAGCYYDPELKQYVYDDQQ